MYKYIKKASQTLFTINKPHFSLFSFPQYTFCTQESPASPVPKHFLETIKEIDPSYARRLDKYIQKKYDLKWDQVQMLFRKKKIKVFSSASQTLSKDPSYLLNPGDVIYLPKSFNKEGVEDQVDPKKELIKAENAKVDLECKDLFNSMLLYEDQKFIALNKLPGISSQGGSLVKLNLYFLFNNYLNWKISALQETPSYAPGIVHRLDKDTSGVMILAKDKTFAAGFAQCLKSRSNITKSYIGVVEGVPRPILTLLHPQSEKKLKQKKAPQNFKDLGFEKRYIVTSAEIGEEESKESRTNYEVLAIVKLNKETFESSYILSPKLFPELELSEKEIKQFFAEEEYETVYNTIIGYEIEGGRKHQIRIHSSGVLETPLISDQKYNNENQMENYVDCILRDWHEKQMKEPDLMWVNGKRVGTVQSEEDASFEKHFKDVVENREFLFLHSRKLEFEVDKQKYSIRAGLPLHMLLYFNSIFKNDVESFISRL